MKKLKGYRKLKEQAREDKQAGMISAGSTPPSLQDYQTRRISRAMTSLENIQNQWKNLIPGAHQGCQHTEESRKEMSKTMKALWQKHEFREKMWRARQKMRRARRARQFREKGECLLRFPRWIHLSTEKELHAYCKTYKRITGKHLKTSDITLY
jgi:hypothetical protein